MQLQSHDEFGIVLHYTDIELWHLLGNKDVP